jgi:uncharacterized membrane protein YphA (DoxX/SURF4 family)
MPLTLGAIMAVHRYHKVVGGLEHFAPMVGGMGLPAWLGYVSPFTELLGGLLVLVGFFHWAGGVCHLYQPLRRDLEGSFA